ncbi:MAG: ATP synthase F1 subunit delta [Mariprofundaceae bacterium]|nr:ATP synthase F1 subunit delta [Mariprofundaceae bacterium]
MNTRSISRRYARALFELEQEGVKLREPLAAVASIVTAPEVAMLLGRSGVPANIKSAVITKAAHNKSKEIDRLVALLCERSKAALLPEIAELVESMARQAASEVEADVLAAVKLDAALKDKIAKVLGKAVGRKVNLNVIHDTGIMGGLVVRIGDRQMDYSLRTRLQDLKRLMVS